jgi:hypothetical protein
MDVGNKGAMEGDEKKYDDNYYDLDDNFINDDDIDMVVEESLSSE